MVQLSSGPLDTIFLLSTLRESRSILKDTEMLPGEAGREK